jgi:hypothetical protein
MFLGEWKSSPNEGRREERRVLWRRVDSVREAPMFVAVATGAARLNTAFSYV